jgi:hypothetical protein
LIIKRCKAGVHGTGRDFYKIQRLIVPVAKCDEMRADRNVNTVFLILRDLTCFSLENGVFLSRLEVISGPNGRPIGNKRAGFIPEYSPRLAFWTVLGRNPEKRDQKPPNKAGHPSFVKTRNSPK